MTEDVKIDVKPYHRVASIGGWAGAGRTLWAISTIGTVFGALIGLVAPLFPVLVGASTLAVAGAAIPASMAIFAAMGLSMGFGGGLMLGRISGTAAAVAEEQEKRLKTWMAKQLTHYNPGAEIAPDAPEIVDGSPTRWQNFKDTCRTYINPRVGIVMTAIGLAGGLIMGAAFLASSGGTAFAMAPALATVTGIANISTNAAAALAYSGGIGAAFGALWNFNFPRITAAVTEFYGNLTSGKSLGREWCSETEQTRRNEKAITPPYNTPETAPRNFASFQELLAKQANHSSSMAKH